MGEHKRTLTDVKNVILSAHEDSGPRDKVCFYNKWAEQYEEDVALLDYRAPSLATECIASHVQGDKGSAKVLDVACGTGLVSVKLREKGFQHFSGVDGSEAMLEVCRRTGLYQDLWPCVLGLEPLPVQAEAYDIVVIVGALSVGQVPVSVIEELWVATKPGGYICLTTRANPDNLEYKAELELTLDEMTRDGSLVRVSVTEVEEWERAVQEHETGYIPGAVYLYRKALHS
ncbi:methyltransferase-like protein 27 [Clupea harengus]|uniref:Methyltransferase-like protein 27 n=1 Tax=Clupea harengus TaxID=7950 RepID=A0A8M1KEW4_CLUHA|nr:methyltransferase-like protein 27 [Clupea harengus]